MSVLPAKAGGQDFDWNYRVYPANAPSGAFDRYAPLVARWQEMAELNNGRYARNRNFTFEDFRGFWGWVSRLEYRDDPFDALITLWGTHLVEVMGVEWSGKMLSHVFGSIDDDLWRKEQAYHATLRRGGCIGFMYGSLIHVGKQHVRVDTIDLPLGPPDSERATRLVSISTERRGDSFLPRLTPMAIF